MFRVPVGGRRAPQAARSFKRGHGDLVQTGHGDLVQKATAFAGYTEFSWADFCAEVAKLEVDVPGLRVLPPVHAPTTFAIAGGRAPTHTNTKSPQWRTSRPKFATSLATLKDKTPGISRGSVVEAPGVEVCDGARGKGGSGGLRLVSGVISRGSAEAMSVGMGAEVGSEPSGCSKCNKWREAIVAALEELERGRLDLARERLTLVRDQTEF